MVRIIGLLLISISCNAQSLNVLSLHQDKQLHVGYTYIICYYKLCVEENRQQEKSYIYRYRYRYGHRYR